MTRRHAIARIAALAALLLAFGCDAADTAPMVATGGGGYTVSFDTDPAPLPLNEHFSMRVSVAELSDAVPTDLAVRVDATMPLHGHGMNVTPTVSAEGPGLFLVEGMLFHMPGMWRLVVTVGVGDAAEEAVFEVEVTEDGGRVVSLSGPRRALAAA
jgi:hypothetical protein